MNFNHFVKCLAIIFIVKCNYLTAQSVIQADSEIESVRVFLNQAQVIRKGSVQLPQGQSVVVLKGLSSKVLTSGLQVKLQDRATLLSVKYQLDYLSVQKNTPTQQKLEDSLEYYRDRLELQNMELKVLGQEEQLVLSNQKIGGNEQTLTVTELRQMADFFRLRLNEIHKAKLKGEREKQLIARKIKLIEQQINENNAGARDLLGEIEMVISAPTAGKVAFETSYIVNDAGWVPLYDIRSESVGKPLQLVYKANVWQRTGENWQKVKLTLATGNPSLGGQKPKLYPWSIDFSRPVPSSVMATPMQKRQVMEADMAFGMDEEMALSEVIETNYRGAVLEYQIPISYNVPSGNRETSVDIRNEKLNATYKHASAPSLDKDVFLMAYVVNWQALQLLPGQATIYFDGAYTGEAYVDPSVTNDTLKLSLGRDPRVIVERKQLEDLTSRRMIGSNIRVARGYQINIRNNTGSEIELLLEEQIPVSRNKSISVSLENNPQQGKLDPVTGIITWSLNIQATQQQTITYAFEVRYPKDEQIDGL